MTDRLPRKTRWGTVAVVAPAAAALLAAATTWAAGHDPAAAGGTGPVAEPVGVVAPADPTADSPEVRQARAQLADDTARLAVLEQNVVRLRTQVAAIRAGTGAAAGAGAGAGATAPTRAAVAGRSGSAPTVRTAPRAAAPRAAAPRRAAPPRVVSAGS
jgi:hypothetical protein